MAKKKFVIQTGTSIGAANVSAISGDIKTSGNLSVAGETFGGNIYQNGNQVLDTSTKFQTNVERRTFTYTTPAIPANQSHEFVMELGVSVVVYGLTVSRPCRVEVFNNAAKTETNPYTFVATDSHLTDDGSVLLSDGSVIQSRQYSIFANLDDPAQPKAYVRISNINNMTSPVTLSLVYFVGISGILA